MIKIATVGYKYLPHYALEDIIVNLIPTILSKSKDLSLCYKDIIEERDNEKTDDLVSKMIESKPDIIHYTNYRDTYNKEKKDKEYLKRVKEVCDIPILLTSANLEAENFAKNLGISYLYTPFNIKEYITKIKTLSQ